MDWTGLLQWSIDQTNGEFNKNIAPMDEITKKWLAEALDNQFVDEIKRIKEILSDLAKPEANDEDRRLVLFEELEEILDSLDRANDFCKLGGIALMINYQNTTTFEKIRIQCLRILSTSNQNNTQVQEYTGQNGGLELLKQLENQSLIIQETILSALSSIIRGESLNNKRKFIDQNGINIILKCLDSQKCKEKVINIMRDLLFYDDSLHKTYHDLSKFANTSGQKNKQTLKLTEDINDDLIKNNELPINLKYKGIVKAQLNQLDFPSLYPLFLINAEYRDSNMRTAFLQCILKLGLNPELKEFLVVHLLKLKQCQDVDEQELQICEEFQLSHTLIFAKELEQTSVLYSMCFGLKIKILSDVYLELQDNKKQKICFFKVNNFAQQTKGYSPILVFKVNEFDDVLNKLVHYGAIQENQANLEQKIAFLQGLNGEMISIIQQNDEESSEDEENEQKGELEQEIQAMLRKIKI